MYLFVMVMYVVLASLFISNVPSAINSMALKRGGLQ